MEPEVIDVQYKHGCWRCGQRLALIYRMAEPTALLAHQMLMRPRTLSAGAYLNFACFVFVASI